jgi:type I restriction enzyme M protein
MLTGELRNQIDSIWNDFWSGGLANPLQVQVIEQITYLIFIKRLDEMQELEERKASNLRKPIERRIFPEGKDKRGEPCVCEFTAMPARLISVRHAVADKARCQMS